MALPAGARRFRAGRVRRALSPGFHAQQHGGAPGKPHAVELCRAHGITTHFSNILGFPSDTEETILEHLERLRRLGPVAVAGRLVRAVHSRWDFRTPGKLSSIAGYAVQSRLAVRAGDHPMAGGIGRVRRDRADDYALATRSFGW